MSQQSRLRSFKFSWVIHPWLDHPTKIRYIFETLRYIWKIYWSAKLGQNQNHHTGPTCAKVSSSSSSLVRTVGGGRVWLWQWSSSSPLSVLGEEAESGPCRSSSHSISSESEAGRESSEGRSWSTRAGFATVTAVKASSASCSWWYRNHLTMRIYSHLFSYRLQLFTKHWRSWTEKKADSKYWNQADNNIHHICS